MFAVKVSRWSSVALLLGFASLSQAQEVSTTTKAPAPKAVNNVAANLQLRHDANFSGEGNAQTFTPSEQLRANIEATLFNEKVDSLLVLGGSKSVSTTQVVEDRPQLYNTFNAVVTDHYALKPYINVYLPSGGSGTDGEVGISPSVTTGDLAIVGGTLELTAEGYFHAALSSRPEDAKVIGADPATRERYSLSTGDSEDEATLVGGKDDPTYTAQYAGIAAFSPSAVKSLNIATVLVATNTYEPNYTFNADGTRTVSFANNPTVENQIKISYALTERAKLVNELWFKHGGFYETRIDSDASDYRVRNVAYLAYTLL